MIDTIFQAITTIDKATIALIMSILSPFLAAYLTYNYKLRANDKERKIEMIKSFNGIIEYINPDNNTYSYNMTRTPDQDEFIKRIVKFKSDFGHIFNKEIEKKLAVIIHRINNCSGFILYKPTNLHIDLINIRNRMKDIYKV